VPVVALLAGGAAWLLYGTSLLGVREIVVDGARIAAPEDVRAAAGVTDGTPLLRLDLGEIADRVRALPPVADVTVRRSFPDTLVITVTERTPAAVVPQPGGFAVLAADGVVFHQVADAPAGVPVVRVQAPGPGDPATMAALRVLPALTPQLRQVLAEVVAPSPTAITLALTDGRVVVWGDAEESELKAAVATTLLDHAGNTIDVTVPDVATVS
jgi:cell division protein FtsQ